jgi:two-component system OmpR family sensor kinase
MNELLARLERATGSQRVFVANAGHELRTPLAILQAELELAGRPGRSREELVEAVAAAAEETERLTRLAEVLLFLAGTDQGGTQLQIQPTEVKALLTTAAQRLTNIAPEGPHIRVEAPDDLVVMVDPQRLRQAADNLLTNALRHSPTDSFVVAKARSDGSMLTIEVLDDGPGFPSAFLPYAFERFRRADSVRARDGGGTGLGLAIVRAIAEAHGGTASAENQAQGGALVRMRLPAHRAAADQELTQH